MSSSDRKQLIARALDEYRARAVPDDLDLWPGIRRRLEASAGRNRPDSRGPWWLPARLAVTAGLLLFLVIVAASLFPQFLPLVRFPADQRAQEAPLPTAVPIIQSVAGYTMTLYPIFADSHQIVVSYTLSIPAGAPAGLNPVTIDSPTLYDRDGMQYSLMSIEGSLTDSFPSARPEASVDRGLIRFDAARLPNKDVVDFQLQLIFGEPMSQEASPTPTAEVFYERETIMEPAGPVPTGEAGDVRPMPGRSDSMIAGPFSVGFILPIDRVRRRAEVPQTVEGGGFAATLSRVTVTRSEARAVLEIVAKDGSLGWRPREVHLDQPAENGIAEQMVRSLDSYKWAGNLVAGDWSRNPLMTYDGPWTLRVEDAVRMDGQQVEGTWVFHFTMPPARRP